MANPQETHSFPTCVIIPNFIVQCETISAQVGNPKKFGNAGPPWDGGMANPFKTCFSTTCVTMPHLVSLGQTI